MQAKEYFERAAENEEAGGHYNLGVMYLKGIGVTRDVKLACRYFILAANAGQPKAFYQLAKMFHRGVGLKKSLPTVKPNYFFFFLVGQNTSICVFATVYPYIMNQYVHNARIL